MTSETQASKEVEPPQPLLRDDQPTCLCCLHFAVDFDSMPEILERKRPTRQPKRHVSA